MSIILGIDASRNRSGGAMVHLKNILEKISIQNYSIKKIHVWSYKKLLDELPNTEWLDKHYSDELESSLINQLLWQKLNFPKEVKKYNCSIVLNTDAGTISRVTPSITMSRDLLSYEKGELKRYRFSLSWIRLILLRFMQNKSLKRSTASIFLTGYSSKLIQLYTGILKNYKIINHGVNDIFRNLKTDYSFSNNEPIKCVYVSNADLYKHQWNVVRAISMLRDDGYNIELKLVGGGYGKAQKKLYRELKVSDPNSEYIQQIEFLPNKKLPGILSSSDIFVFASSCEAFGITLLEGMAAGLPIACSDRSSLPEILVDGGAYFDPENVETIKSSIELLIKNESLRRDYGLRAMDIANDYSWEKSADELMNYVIKVNNNYYNNLKL